MSNLTYSIYEGFGERSKQHFNYSQAVRIGNHIEVSGQGGWDRTTDKCPEDLGVEVDQTFDNIEHALKKAGGTGLDQVYKLRYYITGSMDEFAGPVERVMKERFKNHSPLLTIVQVVSLFGNMRVEIEAEAYVG
ncbi:Endoribonuclease L-PSP/chorismate mutase-like protein [Paraphoma chrysanthemicola]|uniref:Endoribonuclease L-PSP/chorismate mutase-like protein n=1 Tax=Paraphoma chrysanthemicola TaxID=798071 RepID=A0A8K0W2B9_9PLEO|nr:Endoribonuclease L-PSP/chorismate mutase-like protein [Paraphoma chrysanthemicola]